MSFERISDESIARYYENIGQQADADRRHKEHFIASPSVRERADKPRRKMIKRRLQHSLSTGHLSCDGPRKPSDGGRSLG